MKLNRILVTGGAGFIGSHTVDLLLKQDKQVVVLDNLSSGRLTNLNMQHPNLEFVESDVLEYPLIEDLLKNCDAVLHLAAIASVPLTLEEPIYSFQVNVQGLLHVLQAVQSAKRDIRVVYASSAAVYGDATKLPCRDDVLLSSPPISPYALHKINNEQYADLYARAFGVSSLGMRYFNVYGERQDPASSYSGVISRFIDAYQNNQPLTVFGDGLQSRDFIHVKDIAHANVLALASSATGAVNVATGHAETLLSLIKSIEQAGGIAAQINMQPARAGDIKESYAATQFAEQQIGFKAEIRLQEGIKDLMRA